MPEQFVETVHIHNYGCVSDARLALTRLHALIGPNDSGKSTVLGAIRAAGEIIRAPLSGYKDTRAMRGTRITMTVSGHVPGDELVWSFTDSWQLKLPPTRLGNSAVERSPGLDPLAAVRAKLIRWDPDAIRRPCELISEDGPLTVDERGEGVSAVYEAILSRDRTTFDAIEATVRTHFPTVRGIWLPTSHKSKKALGVVLADGTRVHANEMSEGLLYWLAFAVLPYIEPVAILLIEEPENGLHPSRIADVMRILRAVSARTQVILATHSPLVINELQPEEVTIITRAPLAGTRATRIDHTTHFQQRNKVYALGELWLSFADGDTEASLVSSTDPNKQAG